LLVIVLQGEDALVRPVRVGQELAECIGVLERPCLQRLEAPALVDAADGGQDGALGHHVAGAAVDEAARSPRLGSAQVRLGGLAHARALSGCSGVTQERKVVHWSSLDV
jgi:hypothetical protein